MGIIKFVSIDPHRIIVTGRLKHFISAFGEHVIAEEVESAMCIASEKEGAGVIEFHVAPQVNPEPKAANTTRPADGKCMIKKLTSFGEQVPRTGTAARAWDCIDAQVSIDDQGHIDDQGR